MKTSKQDILKAVISAACIVLFLFALIGACYYQNYKHSTDITQAVVIVNNNAVLMDITAVKWTGDMYVITTTDGLKISSAPENVYFIHGGAEESDSFKALCYGGNVKWLN